MAACPASRKQSPAGIIEFEQLLAELAAYASTGAAVLASGATAIAGFAALVASDIRMLRDFGIVTVVDLTVSLLGVMLVLPAALVVGGGARGVQPARPGPEAPDTGAAPAPPLACLEPVATIPALACRLQPSADVVFGRSHTV